MWVSVAVRLGAEQDALLAQVVGDGFGHVADVLASQPAESVDVDAAVVDRRDDLQLEFLAQLEVFLATPGRNVDDARALLLTDLRPRNDLVLDAGHRGELVERARVPPVEQLGPAQVLLDLPVVAE